MKRKYILCILLILSSLLLANWQALVIAYPIFAVCKYICSVFALSYTMKVVLEEIHMPRIKNKTGKRICMIFISILFASYILITIDTFLFHALTFFPGILRYALFDAYGVLYLIFLFPGILWHIGSKDS